MSATSTNVTSTKRVRLSEPDTITSTSPSAAAEACLKAAVVSLLPPFNTVAISEASKLFKLHKSRRYFERILETSKATDFKPKSTKINFSITASHATKNTDEFKAIVTEVEKAAKDCEDLFKALIIKKQELEVTMALQEFRTEFVRIATLLSEIHITFLNSNDFRKDEERLGILVFNFLRCPDVVKFLQAPSEAPEHILPLYKLQSFVPVPAFGTAASETEKNIMEDWYLRLATLILAPLGKYDETVFQNNLSKQRQAMVKLIISKYIK